MKINLLTLLLIITIWVLPVFSQKDSIEMASQYEIKEDVFSVPCKNSERLEAVKNLFKKMGAKDENIKIDKFKDIENFTVLKKGKTDDTIIVGAHYDKVEGGCGAIDNWTGIVIIAHLYNTVKDLDTEKSYLFVAFDKEEPGLLGSAAMVKAIPKEKRDQYCSMINFDSFGFDFPQVLENASNGKMIRYAAILAKELKMPFTFLKMGGGADADSSSFKDKDIPAITFHGLTRNWQSFLHSSNDKLENINISSVFTGYKFAVWFFSKIDSEKCNIFR